MIDNIGFKIVFQVLFIFSFLTVFFFLYVTKVEKDEFVDQMNLIVDDLIPDIKLNSIIPNKIYRDIAFAIISNSIDEQENDITKDNEKNNREVEDKNNDIRDSMFKLIGISAISVTIIVLFAYIVGFHVSVKDHFVTSMITVGIVALTEFMFLTVIAKRYVSADPNEVRKKIGASIRNYVINRVN